MLTGAGKKRYSYNNYEYTDSSSRYSSISKAGVPARWVGCLLNAIEEDVTHVLTFCTQEQVVPPFVASSYIRHRFENAVQKKARPHYWGRKIYSPLFVPTTENQTTT